MKSLVTMKKSYTVKISSRIFKSEKRILHLKLITRCMFLVNSKMANNSFKIMWFEFDTKTHNLIGSKTTTQLLTRNIKCYVYVLEICLVLKSA